MRRTLTALLALLLAAAGLLAAGAGYLAGAEDDVELTHHLIAGDPAAAQGITLTLPAGDQQAQTCWETTVALGTEMLSPETAFTFYPGGKDWEGSIQPGAEIYTGSFSYGISASGSIDFADYLGEGEDPSYRHDATLMVLPLVVYGMKALTRLQVWTTPLWLVLMVVPVLRPEIHLVEALPETERGAGGFGSTGR